jgi:hypothetical protein
MGKISEQKNRFGLSAPKSSKNRKKISKHKIVLGSTIFASLAESKKGKPLKHAEIKYKIKIRL